MGICSSSCCGGTAALQLGPAFTDALTRLGQSRDALYENVLAENEREAVAELLQYLENVRTTLLHLSLPCLLLTCLKRTETDFFSGEPLRALSTLVYSDNIDLQRSASLTFAEITERGSCAALPPSKALLDRGRRDLGTGLANLDCLRCSGR